MLEITHDPQWQQDLQDNAIMYVALVENVNIVEKFWTFTYFVIRQQQ